MALSIILKGVLVLGELVLGTIVLKAALVLLVKILITAAVAMLAYIIGTKFLKYFKKRRDTVLFASTTKAIIDNSPKMTFEQLDALQRKYNDNDIVLAEFDEKTDTIVHHEGGNDVAVSRAGIEQKYKKHMDENGGYIVLEDD